MESTTNPRQRASVRPGLIVEIILKQDQRSGRRTRGVVQEILTNSSFHPHGIKVRLADGQVGRVAAILPEEPGTDKK
ncbi:YwbE family protein [Methanoregula sp.]|uniref:YwbE family protein n=1 Tax=Methanoregula sp. TaxID=2052170 RepID=UPI00356432A7